MTASEPKRIGVSIELKPHAYDPVTNPELFKAWWRAECWPS